MSRFCFAIVTQPAQQVALRTAQRLSNGNPSSQSELFNAKSEGRQRPSQINTSRGLNIYFSEILHPRETSHRADHCVISLPWLQPGAMPAKDFFVNIIQRTLATGFAS